MSFVDNNSRVGLSTQPQVNNTDKSTLGNSKIESAIPSVPTPNTTSTETKDLKSKDVKPLLKRGDQPPLSRAGKIMGITLLAIAVVGIATAILGGVFSMPILMGFGITVTVSIVALLAIGIWQSKRSQHLQKLAAQEGF